MSNKQNQVNRLQASVVGIGRVHFAFIAILAAQIVVYDAWGLITPQMVLHRWIAVAGLFVAVTVVWYLAKVLKKRSVALYTSLTFALITADLLFVSFYVYFQRGMASRAVVLYLIPIIVSMLLLSRSAIFATAALAVAAYVTTAVAYFVMNFNEGYKVELYGEVGFYAALFLIVASLLWVIIRPKR
ncbi:MAG: hypothetical protein U5K77_03720 [Candidatus Saccharibacteria bacterium]|nr:hypothetical protein [Candidatus Saccharibacteria bacterium]